MKALLISLLLVVTGAVHAQVLPVREQARVVNEVLTERLDVLLPSLMQKNGIDMWVLVSREYNEDPVLRTMLPAEWLNARRRTILVFYRDPQTAKYEKLAIARYDVGTAIKGAWDMKKFPDQWDALADVIKTRKPRRIGINTSAHYGHADGMDHTDYLEFMRKLPAGYKNKVVSAEKLAVMWLEARTEREMQLYPQLVEATHQIIAAGFSQQAITPGVTTSEDVEWWFRQKIRESGYDTWFHPSVSIQRSDPQQAEKSFASRPKNNVILPGDLLHVDIGISYLRLNTDVQQHAYVLKPGETEVPAYLQAAFAKGNRLQDILTGHFKQGRSGNQILAAALAQAKSEGIVPTIYTHPLGSHGHAAGPTIGMWDMQGGVPGSGDFPMHYKTAYSIELNAESPVPEWNKNIRIMLEEDGYFDEAGFRYIAGRQQRILAIPGAAAQVSAAPAADDPVQALVGQLDLAKYKATIKSLTQFGDRRQGTERNRKALDWIEAQLKSYGCTNTERLQFDFTQPAVRTPAAPVPARRGGPAGQGGSTLFGSRAAIGVNNDPALQAEERLRVLNAEQTPVGTSKRENVYCTKVGTTRPHEMYIVSAHMDGIGFGEAANDDGSGTALVMELARILSAPGVETERSIRFVLWNNEETGLNGARAYVEQRKDLQGIESPKGSGKYPEPRWLGVIQHDMMLWDHGMPVPKLDAAGKQVLDAKGQPVYVSPKEQRREADVNIEFQSNSKQADASAKLAWMLHAANGKYASDYPAAVGPHMTNTDSVPFMDLVPAISLRENERGMHIGAGWNPNWHQPSDVFSTYSDKDFMLGLNAAQTTLAGVAQLSGAKIKR